MEGPGFPTMLAQVDELQLFARNPHQRIRSGLTALDSIIEGPAAGEVCLFLGRSFSGKSQVAINLLLNNRSLSQIFFSMEMPAHQVMQRLYAMWSGMAHSDVLHQTMEGRLPSKFSELPDAFPRTVILEQPMGLGDMSAYINEFESWYGDRPAHVVIDYLELMVSGMKEGGGFQETELLARSVKRWAKEEHMAVFLIHQTNRRENSWEPPNEDSAKGAGYTEADVVVGLWQEGKNPALSIQERKDAFGRIQMNVIKNRINGQVTFEDLTYQLLPSLKLHDLHEPENEVIPW